MSIYMQSTLEIKASAMPRFIAAMTTAVPILEGFGWKLETAFIQYTGRLNTVVDIWRMDDFGHYERGLQALMAHPAYPQFEQVINEAVEKEVVVLGSALPYSSMKPAGA